LDFFKERATPNCERAQHNESGVEGQLFGILAQWSTEPEAHSVLILEDPI
jgi:hypothetical protein